jgi:3-phosphoshikimate 1-carboxyvinyltransferase
MNISISPSAVSGKLIAAASKSAMQRACALALLHPGITLIHNPGNSNDDQAALSIIKALGAKIESKPDGALAITGVNLDREEDVKTLDCGESGLSIRMFVPIAAICKERVTVTGSGSLLSRPMDFFDSVLPQLSVAVESNQGKLPLIIQGPLRPVDVRIDGSLSSQFLTGLLFAFAASATMPVNITVDNLKSKPYIDLSLQLLDHFGYTIKNNEYQNFHIQNGNRLGTQDISYTVEGDWSGAAFLLVAGAIAGNVVIKGLDVFSAQADKAILTALSLSGATLSTSVDQIEVSASPLRAFQFDATDCPDLFPPLVALAAYCEGTTIIEGATRLRHKESNRAVTLQEEFGKLGVVVRLQDDLMIVEGGNNLKGANVQSHHDHRIAMALTVAALKADGDTTIIDAEAINKSYPDFYKHMKALGVAIQ